MADARDGRVRVGARGQDDGAASKRAHNGSWWRTQSFWEEENLHRRGYIYTAQRYQQWFSTRTIANNSLISSGSS
jgi:hypothetical protein